MTNERRVKPFRIGRRQVVRIPREFELPGKLAAIRKEGNRLVIEPKSSPKKSLLALLATMKPIDERFPEIEDLPPEPVDFGLPDRTRTRSSRTKLASPLAGEVASARKRRGG